MLLFNPVIAPPDLFERFPSACVICKIFALTFGAFESVSNRYLRLSASKGIFVTARPLATLPSLDMAVTRLLILVISKFNAPILFIWRTKFCNCADKAGRFFVACVDALPPIFDNADTMLMSPLVSTALTLAIPDARSLTAEDIPWIEFASTPENLLSARTIDVISEDLPPLNPVAASEMLLIPLAIFESFAVSNDMLSRSLFMLFTRLSMELLAFAESALIFICNSSMSAIYAPTFYAK